MSATVTCQRVQHVSIARPRGDASAAAMRRFYGDTLGLEEIAPPHTLADSDLIWFRVGDDELHVFPIDGNPVDLGQHLCLHVDDVDALRKRLEAYGIAVVDPEVIPNRPRFFCQDPCGNRVEFTTILGPYNAP